MRQHVNSSYLLTLTLSLTLTLTLSFYVQKLEPGAKRVGRERGLRRHLARLHVERRGLYSVLPVYLRVSQPQPRYTAVLFYLYIRMFLQTLFFI